MFPTGDVDADALLRFVALVRNVPRMLLVRPRSEWVPHVSDAERARVHEVAPGVQLLDLRFGYDDVQDVTAAIGQLVGPADAHRVRYFVIDDRSITVPLRGMARWRALLFRRLAAGSMAAADWFRLPPERTSSLGMRTARPAGVGTRLADGAPMRERTI